MTLPPNLMCALAELSRVIFSAFPKMAPWCKKWLFMVCRGHLSLSIRIGPSPIR